MPFRQYASLVRVTSNGLYVPVYDRQVNEGGRRWDRGGLAPRETNYTHGCVIFMGGSLKVKYLKDMTSPDARRVEAYSIKIIGPVRHILSILSLDKREVYQDFS